MSTFEELNQLELFDFRVDSLTTSLDRDDVLTVHGRRDFSYYRNAAIRFVETSYVECPVDFHHAFFREATEVEKANVASRVGYVDGRV